MLGREPPTDREPEPFAAVILCTADRDQVDDRTRSKWSRALRYAAEYKDLNEPLRDFIKRKGGINRCASRFARSRLIRHIDWNEIEVTRYPGLTVVGSA